jgi:hypothetical protein
MTRLQLTIHNCGPYLEYLESPILNLTFSVVRDRSSLTHKASEIGIVSETEPGISFVIIEDNASV